ncbi:unnamed protein product [Effrenium voratum]|uniref:Uncharacterized protein n=1 Tax=Effrenium voratum TaxID=2562239 RepID=A0AA36IBL5_9DINO|nr:unnamed protein product [Effrenium voratum]
MFACCTGPVRDAIEVQVEELKPAPVEEVSKPESSAPDNVTEDTSAPNADAVAKAEDKFWQAIFREEDSNLYMDYLPSKHVPGGASYKIRITMEISLTVEDAVMCFMDFSPRKLNYATDYRDIKVDQILKQSGNLPGGIPEESIATVSPNFSGVLMLMRAFLPKTFPVRLCLGRDDRGYHFIQETLGADGHPDGRTKKEGSILPHPTDKQNASSCL